MFWAFGKPNGVGIKGYLGHGYNERLDKLTRKLGEERKWVAGILGVFWLGFAFISLYQFLGNLLH